METSLSTTPQKPKGVKRQKLRKWILRASLAAAVLAVLTFVIAAVGYKLGVLGLPTSFGLLNLKVGPLLLILSFFGGLLSLICALAIQPRKGFGVAILALVVGLVGLGKLSGTKSNVEKLPFIHDITTDTQNPPIFTAALLAERAAVKGVNTADYIGKKDTRDKKLVSALQTQAYPDIRPLVLSESPDIVFGRVEATVKHMGWEMKTSDSAKGIIEATDTTFWYGFQDDVIVRIRPSEGGGSLVDVRSLSRVGGSDLGKNADRVRKFLAALKEG